METVVANFNAEDRFAAFVAVLNNTGDGVIIANKDMKFVLWNPAAMAIFGQGMTDNPDWSTFYGCYHEDRVTPFKNEELPLVLAVGGESANVTMFVRNIVKPNGIWLSVVGVPIHFGGVVVFRDITESYKACQGLKAIIASHEEVLAKVEIPAEIPAERATEVVVEIHGPATVITHDFPNPDPRSPTVS